VPSLLTVLARALVCPDTKPVVIVDELVTQRNARVTLPSNIEPTATLPSSLIPLMDDEV